MTRHHRAYRNATWRRPAPSMAGLGPTLTGFHLAGSRIDDHLTLLIIRDDDDLPNRSNAITRVDLNGNGPTLGVLLRDLNRLNDCGRGGLEAGEYCFIVHIQPALRARLPFPQDRPGIGVHPPFPDRALSVDLEKVGGCPGCRLETHLQDLAALGMPFGCGNGIEQR